MTFTYALVVGAVLPFLVAAIAKTTWPSQKKRILTILLAVLATAIGVALQYRPDWWQAAAAVLAVIVGVGQTVYTVLKPTGALDWLEQLGSPERAEQG